MTTLMTLEHAGAKVAPSTSANYGRRWWILACPWAWLN